MKFEIRTYKKYYETGYEPEMSSLKAFEIKADKKEKKEKICKFNCRFIVKLILF